MAIWVLDQVWDLSDSEFVFVARLSLHSSAPLVSLIAFQLTHVAQNTFCPRFLSFLSTNTIVNCPKWRPIPDPFLQSRAFVKVVHQNTSSWSVYFSGFQTTFLSRKGSAIKHLFVNVGVPPHD